MCVSAAFLRAVVVQATTLGAVNQPEQPVGFGACDGMGRDGLGVEAKERRPTCPNDDLHRPSIYRCHVAYDGAMCWDSRSARATRALTGLAAVLQGITDMSHT